MLGLKRKELKFSPYNAAWPSRFEQEAERIRNELSDHCRAVWHIGSTSVPGLMSKPIIDIAIPFRDHWHLWHIANGLRELGYGTMSVHLEPGHWYCRYEEDGLRFFQAHVWQEDAAGLQKHLRFPEILRRREDLREEYEKLKWEWAEQSNWNRIDYSFCKSDFVARVLAEGSE